MSFWTGRSVLVTGGAGFLGGHVVRKLRERGVDPYRIRIPRSAECDLRERHNVAQVVQGADIVIHLAATLGGIDYLDRFPGRIFYDNVMMGTLIMEESRSTGVERVVLVGSSCSYPSVATYPATESQLWDGYPEEPTATYGLAKRMLFQQAKVYEAQYGLHSICLIPPNLYGPGDHFGPANSHVVPALITKLMTAVKHGHETVNLWGSGNQCRDFLYVEDAADGILQATERVSESEPINLGTGVDVRIRHVATLIADLTGFKGQFIWDRSALQGRLHGALDVSRARKLFGFEATTTLRDGLARTVDWYQKSQSDERSEGA